MVKVFCYLVVIVLFISCSVSNNGNDSSGRNNFTQIRYDDGTPLEWPANYPKEGFQLHKDHKYGFDISPNYPYYINNINRTTKEDSIANVSIPKGEIGYVNVFTDSGFAVIDYNYYYCDPDSYIDLSGYYEYINSKETQEHTLRIGESKIALCKSFEGNVEKIQDLYMHGYNWKSDYNFHTYILGDKNSKDSRHNLIRTDAFWDEFNKTYGQAIVKHGNIRNEYINVDKITEDNYVVETHEIKYILTRARGNYPSYLNCARGDIDMLMDEIDYDVNYRNHEKRVMVQLGYPAKRFWPLQANNGRIELCGTPDFYHGDPRNGAAIKLKLEPLNVDRCSDEWSWDASVIWEGGTWKLDYGSETPREIATTNNVNPNCAVFMDDTTPDEIRYIEEIPLGKAAVARDKGRYTIAILPWLGNMTTRTAIHELGHTMGLTDVNDSYLSNRITDETMEGNLMHSSNTRKGYRLRYRGMVPSEPEEQNMSCSNKAADGKCLELQWDCLHKERGACLMPNLDPYNR
jgi:hypothetical protein